jgi:putative FmdB family regulatory protein
MPRYEHHCRVCELDWEEDYGLSDPVSDTCPECGSQDMYRCVTTSGAIHFKGAGWSEDGYYKNAALDTHKGRLKLYDRKEDYNREAKGEAREITKRKLMQQNEVIKRTLGHSSVIKEAEAERKIKKAEDKAGV